MIELKMKGTVPQACLDCLMPLDDAAQKIFVAFACPDCKIMKDWVAKGVAAERARAPAFGSD